MSELLTCIECGHYPVTSTLTNCHKCGKNIRGSVCQLCDQKDKISNLNKYSWSALTHLKAHHSDNKDFYYHTKCVAKFHKPSAVWQCPACKTTFDLPERTKSHYISVKCDNCGTSDKERDCTICNEPVLCSLGRNLCFWNYDPVHYTDLPHTDFKLVHSDCYAFELDRRKKKDLCELCGGKKDRTLFSWLFSNRVCRKCKEHPPRL